jgi:glyoxylase-like metal-dependent hydrolase (beta-lactamase superfamily II)
VLADGVYVLTAEGDPNVAAVEGEDFLVCFEAMATPAMAQRWLERLREHTDKPVRHLVLSHHHAVLGASGADQIIMHAETKRLVAERGHEDWDVEFGRMPRLFTGHTEIPGLTRPTLTFADRMSIELGGDRGSLELAWLGRGHTSGDIVAWLPEQRILLAGDLVGRAVELTGDFLTGLVGAVSDVQRRGGTLGEAYAAAREALAPAYGGMAVFDHALVFDVQRAWDEVAGEQPRMWTVDRDHSVWDRLRG